MAILEQSLISKQYGKRTKELPTIMDQWGAGRHFWWAEFKQRSEVSEGAMQMLTLPGVWGRENRWEGPLGDNMILVSVFRE